MAKKHRRHHGHNKVMEFIGFYSMMPLILLIRAMPLKLMLGLAWGIGFAGYYIAPFRKKVVMENLRMAFGDEKSEKELRRIARDCYVNFSLMAMEFIMMPSIRPERVRELICELEGEEYYDEIRRRPEADCLVITGHIDNWEIIGSYFCSIGIPLSVIARPIHNVYLEREIKTTRERVGLQIISTRGNPREILSHIRAGRIVAFLSDQDARRAGVFVNFFGRPASTFAGAAVLGQRAKKPIFPVFSVRVGLDRHKVIFTPPIYPRESPDGNPTSPEVVREIVQEYTAALESVIRRYPGQYFWFHRRWKTQPKKPRACRLQVKNS